MTLQLFFVLAKKKKKKADSWEQIIFYRDELKSYTKWPNQY